MPHASAGQVRLLFPVLIVTAGVLQVGCADPRSEIDDVGPGGQPVVHPNDNSVPAGTRRDGVLELRLEARLAHWEVEDAAVTVLAFAEEGGSPTIPGPLLRVPAGTEVRVSIRNSIPDSVRIGLPGPGLREEGMRSLADAVLIVHGLRAGTVADDTIHVPRGQPREVRFRADAPGTYLYRGAASDRSIAGWTGRDAQLTGAIVVDEEGSRPDPDERIFVVTMLDQFPDSTGPPPWEDLFRMAINGRSWPNTERLHYGVGDTARWRVINASGLEHPMHLHGFHFRVLAEGDGTSETTYPPGATRLAVTQHMEPGSTFRMAWVPTRPGNWIFHCHILGHVVPIVERDEEARAHDVHDVARHPLEAMAGLVLGISVSDAGATTRVPEPDRRLRLLAQQRETARGGVARGLSCTRTPRPQPIRSWCPGRRWF